MYAIKSKRKICQLIYFGMSIECDYVGFSWAIPYAKSHM